MPGSLELPEDMGEDRLQAVQDWLRVEGYAYRFRQKRWRIWIRPDRPGEGLRPDGIEEDEKPNEYPSGATINVSFFFVFFLKHKSIVTAAMSSGGQPNIHCVTHIPEAWVSGLSGRGHCGCGALQGK